ncbi:MAG: hypothetical protein K6F63_06060 [Lachnospiraceae bacterium]|nr:hypothetical protein [Lachnospiraceae bacterium]
MTEINEKDEDLLKRNVNKGKGRGRMVLGLILIIVAVGIYGYRNGFFDSPFNSKKNNSEYLAEEMVKKLESVDRFVLSELELYPEERGTAVGKVQIRNGGANSFVNLLLNNVTLDCHYTENGYAITEATWNIPLASFDFGDIDLKKIASSGILKNSKVKKLIKKYRLVYLNELFKNAITARDDNFINNLDGVILVETEMKFELFPDDFDRAVQACFDTAEKDKALKKAYRSLSDDDVTYEDFLAKAREKAVQKRNGDAALQKLSGAFYINVSEGITMADLVSEQAGTDTEQQTKHIKAGYTYLNKDVGFVLDYEDGTNIINLFGSGKYNSKATSFNTTGSVSVKGPKAKDPNGDKMTFSTVDLQVFRAGEVYASGTIIFDYLNSSSIDRKNIFLESESRSQRVEIITVKTDGSTEESNIYITR